MKVLALYARLCLVYLLLYSPIFLVPMGILLVMGYLGSNILISIFTIITFLAFLFASIWVGARTRLSIYFILKEGKNFKESIKASRSMMKKLGPKGLFRIVRLEK